MSLTPTKAPHSHETSAQYAAFAGTRCIASGDLGYVALWAKEVRDQDPLPSILVFNDATGDVVELDLRGTTGEIISRLPKRAASDVGVASTEVNAEPSRGPGRPKLGVVAREVTLLPRHWEWLATQPGGASVALRKLVEEARRVNAGKDRQRQAREAAYRFMSVMAGNLPGFEEAARALFADDAARFETLIASWPEDIRAHALKLARRAFDLPPVQNQGKNGFWRENGLDIKPQSE